VEVRVFEYQENEYIKFGCGLYRLQFSAVNPTKAKCIWNEILEAIYLICPDNLSIETVWEYCCRYQMRQLTREVECVGHRLFMGTYCILSNTSHTLKKDQPKTGVCCLFTHKR
jgi:hypothetical protein